MGAPTPLPAPQLLTGLRSSNPGIPPPSSWRGFFWCQQHTAGTGKGQRTKETDPGKRCSSAPATRSPAPLPCSPTLLPAPLLPCSPTLLPTTLLPTTLLPYPAPLPCYLLPATLLPCSLPCYPLPCYPVTRSPAPCHQTQTRLSSQEIRSLSIARSDHKRVLIPEKKNKHKMHLLKVGVHPMRFSILCLPTTLPATPHRERKEASSALETPPCLTGQEGALLGGAPSLRPPQ